MKRFAVVAALSLACSFASSFVSTAHALPLADRVPDDAIAYFGWSGADALAADYASTHLKAVLDETRVRDLFGKYLDDLEAKVVKSAPQAQEPFRVLRTLGGPAWHYPTALSIGKPDISNLDEPKFHMALISQAGKDAPALANELNALIEKAGPTPIPVKAIAKGDLVCLAVGYDSPEQAIAGDGGSPYLAQSATFATAARQVNSKAASVTFVNVEAIVALAESAVEQKDADAKAKVDAFLDASTLRNVKSYICAGGFDGKDWVDQACLAVPGKHDGGVFAAWPTGPVDPALLKTVPADSTFFASVRFDAGKFVSSMREALGKTDDQSLQYFNMGLSAVQQALGTNVVDNILTPSGPDWVFYSSPRTGAGLLGMVGVNKLDDPDKMKKGLTTASVNLCNWINVAIRKGGGGDSGISIHGASTKIGDVDVNYLATPLFAPSWAISNGRLYFGMYPDVVGAAARQAEKNGPSIAESPKYQALLRRLGNASPDASSYYDLQTSASYGSMYPQIMALVRYAGAGDLFGLTLPEPLLPPIDVLLDHLAPAGSVSWSDEEGFHAKSVEAFPGAKIVSEQGAIASAGVSSSALVTSIVLPAFNRARETANRVKSASNERQIGTAIALYANENGGKYPPDLGTLTKTEDLVPEVFTTPRSGKSLPPPPTAGNADAIAQFVNDNSEYVYVGQGMTNQVAAETLVLYENPEGLEDGINILYGDGHVEFIMMDQAMQMIDAAKQAAPK